MQIWRGPPGDRQQEAPAAFCRCCGGALYAGEPAHRTAAGLICEDCFAAFAEAYFAADEIIVGEEDGP